MGGFGCVLGSFGEFEKSFLLLRMPSVRKPNPAFERSEHFDSVFERPFLTYVERSNAQRKEGKLRHLALAFER